MKKLLTSFLITFLIFASCKNQNFVEYIERGFSKPTVQDVHFSESSLGDGNKIYVPSERDIEVEFTIKNKYEKEITGTLQLPEEKKEFFHTVPYISSLTPTKMVITFKFKATAEPEAINHFLGESVPVDLRIHDKKTNRLLSKQNINANCNTAPLPIPDNKIVYKAETDEYVIELPRNNGIHNDLKEVKLLLSSIYGTEGVKTTIVPINTSTEGSLHTLTIKGNMEGQLATPQGDRKLKAIVYDKAGLNSSSQQTSKMRVFTSLTLVPPNDDVDLESLKAEGAIVPKIKELVDYFQTQENWEDAGYTVSYESDDFKLEKSGDTYKFKPKNPSLITAGSYNITVKLSSANISPSPLTKTYEINVLGNDDAGIKTSTFAITDVTNYVYKDYPKLTIPTPTFVNDGPNGKTCEVIVPYTSYKTKLKVHVEAVGNGTIRRAPSDVDEAKARDLLVEDLGENSGSEKILTFYAYASDNITHKIYTIKFIRGASVEVTARLMNKVLQSDDCKLEMNWVYGKKEINIHKNEESNRDSLTVARGAEVTFTITTGEKDVIKKCSSSDAGHPQITIDNSKTMSFKLTANADFVLTADVGAEASFKWVDIKGNDSTGYTKAHVQYYLNDQEKNYSYMIVTGTPSPIPEIAIQKDKPCVFWIEGLNPERHRILDWVVNTETLTTSKSDGSIILSDDKTSLTIKKPNGDYVVKVSTIPLYELEIQVCDSNGASITGHNYSFEVRKGTPTGGEIQKNPLGKYAGILSNIPVYITAQEGSNSEYEIDKWESKKTTDTTFAPLTGSSEINKRNLNITKDTTVRLILKKKKFNINWSIEGSDQNISDPSKKTVVKVGDAPLASGTAKSVEIGNNIEFEITNLEEGRTIKGWEVDGNLKTTNETEITIENDKKKLTLTNIRQAHTVKLVLEPKKYLVTVYIAKPEAVAHGYALKTTKNGDEITGTMGEGTIAGDTKYSYSDVEHGSKMIFEAATQDSIYDIDRWQYKPKNNNSWRDVTFSPGPNQYECSNDLKKLKWTVDDTTTLRVVLKPKTFNIAWSVEGETDVNITTKVNNSPVTPPSSTNCNAVFGARVDFSVGSIPAGKKIKGWKVNNDLKTASETGITIENDKKKLTLINIQQAYTIVLVLEDVIYRVEVDIEPPQEGISPPPHNYTIKATKGGNIIQPDTGTTIFSNVTPGEIELEAVLSIPPAATLTYIVKEWKYRLRGGDWTSFTDDSHYVEKPTKIKYTINSDIDFKVILKYTPVKFTVVPNGSVACFLTVKDENNSTILNDFNLIMDSPSVDVDGNGKKILKVSLSGYVGYGVVLWRINGKVEKSFFDREWKNAIEHEFKAGDEVEITLDKIIRLGFFFGDGYFHNINEPYKGKIKITITASEGYVFPNGDKGTVIDNGLILASDNAFFAEHADEKVSFKVTRNAKINILVEDLPSGKTVSWKYLDKNSRPQPFSGENVPSENAMNPVKNWKIIEAYNNMLILMQIRSI